MAALGVYLLIYITRLHQLICLSYRWCVSFKIANSRSIRSLREINIKVNDFVCGCFSLYSLYVQYQEQRANINSSTSSL